jgi:hypothetical protein
LCALGANGRRFCAAAQLHRWFGRQERHGNTKSTVKTGDSGVVWGKAERKIYATTKPQRPVQASLERRRLRLRLVQQFSSGAPSTDLHLCQLKGCAPVPAPQAVKLTSTWGGP